MDVYFRKKVIGNKQNGNITVCLKKTKSDFVGI